MSNTPIPLTYHYLTHHIIPGPQSVSYFIPLVLLHIAILIPRSSLPQWQSISLFMPVIVGCTAHAWWEMGGVDVISVDRLLWALLLLVLRDPWKDFRRVIRGGGDVKGGGNANKAGMEIRTGVPAAADGGGVSEQTTALIQPTNHEVDRKADLDSNKADWSVRMEDQPYPATLYSRLSWVAVLLISIRLTNWKINTPSHDRSQPRLPAFHSRTAFAKHAVLSFIRGYIILDLTRAYISHDPYFTDPTVSIRSPLPSPTSLQLAPPQLLRSLVVGAQAWALLSQMFYLPCLLPVGLHALGWLPDEWSPHNWPPYFGSPRAIFSQGVRGFWGQYWHQTMRWSVSGPGYALANMMRLGSGSMLRYAVISAVAFGLSGVVHMGLVPPEPLHATVNPNTIRLCVAAFFWVQPLAMFGELLVARIFARTTDLQYWQHGPALRLRMLANGVWVIAWFTLALSLLGEAGRQLGYWRVWPVPVSVWQGVRGAGWVAWPVPLSHGK
ncbi:hypothetical protein LTR36_005978 [Oleoguttula mirabilis]|uniref:Wax synthase domain-containing protein n=1 Tax=Oleoguttula mirabilis TaxID=1507867 RepID=A0AAV9JCX2_9PEZI|nr:hypothetical protein LTR36_005978 [Oleoguttula mirabilis]